MSSIPDQRVLMPDQDDNRPPTSIPTPPDSASTRAADRSIRARLGAFVEHPRVQAFIIALIALNAVTLGLETSPAVTERIGGLLQVVDQVILAVFVLEIALKLFALRGRFFASGWNVFDFLIVAIALVPDSGPFAVLRTLRVLRLLRLVTKLPRLRRIVESMMRAIPSIGWLSLLLVLIFYIFAVMGTSLFGAAFPQWFGSLGASLYTLFQVMTLESWSMGIARPVMEEFPAAPLFFVPFILIATYSMLNLFIAVVVSTMQSLHDEEKAAIAEETGLYGDTADELRALRERIASMEALLREHLPPKGGDSGLGIRDS
jgi:voltage-gated sodium channel